MRKNLFALITLLVPILLVAGCLNSNSPQTEIPVIKATSIAVDIKDDNNLIKGAWRVLPDVNPDIYTTSGKKVTFYTDIDSISFNIKRGEVYDFIILLNEKDSAHTRIQYEPSYLDKLKGASKYDYKDERYIPAFTYQPSTDEELVRLNREYNLDSIAGQGNEISKIINLMY